MTFSFLSMKHIVPIIKTFLKPQGYFLVVLFIICIGCGNKIEDLPNEEEKNLNFNQAENVEFIFSKDGVTTAKLQAKIFIENENAKPPYIDIKDSITAVFYNSQLEVINQIQAEFGRYYPESGNFILRDRVKAWNEQGDRLETSELIWNQSIKRFYTEQTVKITMDGRVNYGDGLEANEDLSYIKIYHQRGQLPMNDNDFLLEEKATKPMQEQKPQPAQNGPEL